MRNSIENGLYHDFERTITAHNLFLANLLSFVLLFHDIGFCPSRIRNT